MLRAAGDIHRLAILYLLAAEPTNLTDIVHRTKLSPSLVSHHMKVLRGSGWVTKSKYGKEVTYYLVDSAVGVLQKLLKKHS